MSGAGSSEVRNPQIGSDITQEWLDYMLTTYERRRDPMAAVVVAKYEVKPGTKPGENVASELVKIWVEAELTTARKEEEEEEEDTKHNKRTNTKSHNEHCETACNLKTTTKQKEEEKEEEDGEDNTSIEPTTTTTTTTANTDTTTKEYNLMAKFNNGSEMDRESTRAMQADLNELLIYSDVVNELNAFQQRVAGGKYPIGVPEFVYGVCTGDEYVLVMQDVSVMGYKTEPKQKGLDLLHTLMAAEHLARFHALSHAHNQAHDFLQRYPSYMMDESLISFFAAFAGIIYDGALQVLNQRPDLGPLAAKLKDNRDHLLARLVAVISLQDNAHRVVCLAHGDAWTNNLMYRHNEDANAEGNDSKQPTDLLLIDWGLVRWRNPILDLHQLVYNCTSLSLRRRHLQDILKRYHDTFTAVTRDLGASVADYDYAALLKEWKRTSIFGFMQAGIFANTIVLSNKAHEGFVKGTPSSGLKGMIAKGVAKIMVPLVMRGWLTWMILSSIKKKFESLFEELRSGENELMNATLIDLMLEAEENGVIDE